MYKNKRFNKGTKTKAPLNTIGEDTTIKIPRLENPIDKENETNNENDNNEKELFSQEALEAIPASQEPTQRYLSQRSTLCRTQSRSTQRPPTTYFELVLIKSGVNLDSPDNFVISCDHVAFVCKFREIFVQCQNYPSNVETFKTGLKNALNDKNLAMKLLSGCTINLPGDENPYLSQDSMMVNFLMIDFLQEIAINVLLDKVEEISKTETSASSDVPILPLMLSQLRYVTQSHEDLIYTRIVDIFEGAVTSVQWDIIANAEMVFKSSKHDAFAEMLLNNFASNKDVFHSITTKTFTNLCLSPKMQTKLRKKAVNYIKDGCPPKMLPLLVKLFLKILNEDDEDVLRDLVTDLRDILMGEFDCSKPEVEKSLVDVFNNITQGLTRSKSFFDSWQRLIQNLAPANFRPIDFVILLKMISIKEERSNSIETIIRRRIKLEHITIDILTVTKDKYAPILGQLINIFLQILHDFLKEKNKLISDFARNSYNIIFGVSESTQKDILLKLVELTCDKSPSSMTTAALELIKDIRIKYPANVQNWGMVLMPLLDRISDMNLPQTRLVMELLCSIAFPAPPLDECPALQDQIDMLVKKQIINRMPKVKKQGIIGAVQMIDNVARIDEEETDCMYDLNTSYNTIEELPEGRGKIAANYISRVHSTTLYCPESLALFYDELASVCSSNNQRNENALCLDRPFVIWLCELITYYFQNSFVIEDNPKEELGIKLSYQKCINTPEDTNTPTESELVPIAVNISQLVLSPSTEASSSILVLAPLFNLMRVLHFARYDGSLEMINALLGCGIILPKVFENIDNVDIFYEYDEVQSKYILDIYFHTVNWIRETISSFSCQNDPMIRGKVLIRLVDLIKIEESVRKLLVHAPADYIPPICQFMTMPTPPVPIKKTAGRKKPSGKGGEKKKNLNASSEPMETEATMANMTVASTARISTSKPTKSYLGKFETTYGPKEIYRQMNPDIMLILKANFSIKYPRPEEEIQNSIGLLEFKFIITDVVNKLESITGVKKFTTDQQLQYISYPIYFITDIVNQFLDPIMNNFHEISTAILTTVQRVDGALGNADLFTDEMNYLKICFGLCLRLLAALFSWSGFGDAANKKILKGALLGVLGKSVRQQYINKDTSTLAFEVFNKCRATEASAVDIKSAVHLYHLIQSLTKFATKKDLEQDTKNLCKVLLCRKWFNFDGTMERGTICNIYLDELVKGYLRRSDFRRQKTILTAILEETKFLKSKENSLRSFPNFNKANFPMLFRGLCETLIGTLSAAVSESKQGGSDQLRVWEKSCEILNTLLEIVQSLDIPRNFSLFLKHAHFYLKIVLQHGLAVYENFLRENPERVNELLKNLQVTTRFLHNLCCHSKALKNTSILSLIPPLRETVENLVFRVKALLAANKCASVFWMGNLKNKDLHGDEILSQTSSWSSAANDANSDEEIPDDDASIEETILGDNENDSNATTMNSITDASRSTCI
ncbi:Fanconi anemia group D2 protein homolog [Episyrphus balteatus]|uniref:Fanconi anemia group D2 protein homolog n=1 Tax=Episyrphus balteatus TaxID=286459 RepID=UPI0024853530|nr:Fanconi anemia group D2 protein homolog [Episyrphus balteatus]